MRKLVDGEVKLVDEPALTALNMRLRDDYVVDCAKGVERWNKIIEKTGVKFRLELPHVAFHRQIGEFKDVKVVAEGRASSSEAAWAKDEGCMAAVEGGRRLHRGADEAGARSPASSPAGSRRRRSASTTSPAISNT